MSAELLQTGHNNLSQMALVVTIGDLDSLVELAFAERACDRGSELAGLLAGAIVGDQAIDHHADRPCRHEEQHNDHDTGRPPHGFPHTAWVKTYGALLQEEHRPDLRL